MTAAAQIQPERRDEADRAALAYLVVGFAMLLVMGIFGLVMRLDQAGLWVIAPDRFYAVMTLHGIGMVAASLLAAMGGMIGVLGGTVRLDARMLWTALVLSLIGSGFVVFATLVGDFGAGWTVLYPLPFDSQGAWTRWAALAALFGILLVAVAFLLYCLELLRATVAHAGGLGRALALDYLFSFGRRGAASVPSPAQLVATVVAIDGVVTVLAGAVYLVPQFAIAAGLISGVNALFAKNFLYLFGHTLANLTIYLAAALVYATLPHYTGREWKSTWPVVLGLNLVIILVLLPYPHHLYQDFAQPIWLQVVGQIGSYGVAVPAFLVTIIGGMGQIYRSGMRWQVATILFAIGLWGWTVGGIGAVIDATIPVNQIMHNTLWVPAHFHTYYLLGALAFSTGYMYHLIGARSGGGETTFSRAAAWLYGLGGAGFVLMLFVSGGMSVPRRFAMHIAAWQWPDKISVAFVGVSAIALAWLGGECLIRLKAAWAGQATPP
ncbi:MAG TPA: cbb3-type cytochrome c oxidase subunit I [Stellaceae bacterium]|nr:cbb3-type cytochrome c oxidase subunit I [Stellaceae bacterium]HEV2334842.1 cbb3-type cytochrome c oxidase subunit I [Stellaceae bacterium]